MNKREYEEICISLKRNTNQKKKTNASRDI